MDYKNIPGKYRPIPFWSWNEKLNTEETKRQICMMDKAGLGGFFMHARGGLQTDYMSEEWFQNVDISVKTAKERKMRAWAYDENGWPSGFGNGAVNGLGVDYQQKWLRMEDTFTHKDTAIAKCGNHYFYYEINEFYVDNLDEKVVRAFLNAVYEPYYQKYGTQIEGFFTDEPAISRDGIPWSFVMEENYRNRYGENLSEHLEELFLDVGNFKEVRIKFYSMCAELFNKAFFKQIYDWCEARGLKLTGHLVLEDTLSSQVTTNGACMPHYEYFHIPGMDWLGRNVENVLTHYQVGSAAAQLGKEAVLSESFAMCGHNVSFAELKGIYEWQMVRGINLLCQHLQGYSNRGIRKRDYPPAMYYQQPWWSVYDKFNEAMAREGMLLTIGKPRARVLLLHPQTTAWSLFTPMGDNGALQELEQKLQNIIQILEHKHIEFHFGDEILLKRHGKAENGKLTVGRMTYDTVIVSACSVLLESTQKLLADFKQQGGTITTADDLPIYAITDLEELMYTGRTLDNATLHFFVNTSPERKKATFKCGGKRLDIETGDLLPFSGSYEFEPWGSLMLIEGEHTARSISTEAMPTYHTLTGNFKVAVGTENILTLDCCDYYFNGELQEKNGYVLNVASRANEIGKAVAIHQDYHVKIEHIPQTLYLVCETPQQFNICINGKALQKKSCGYDADISFVRFDIADMVQIGENIISFDCNFVQSEVLYENLRKAYRFETEKNKLVYDMEIEPIYLVGSFGVKTEGTWTQCEKNAVRYAGDFVLEALPEEINLQNIEQQGFPFFSGQLTLEGDVNVQGENPVLLLNRKGVNAITLSANGVEKTYLYADRILLKEFNASGKTHIKLTLINNLRNRMGPHHLPQGEIYSVGPPSFYKEPCVWNTEGEPNWNPAYCFVRFGI